MIRMRLALVSAALTAALALSVCGGASIETFDVGNRPITMAYDGYRAPIVLPEEFEPLAGFTAPL